MLTQAELKSQLNYNEETGIFTRLLSNSPRVKIGDIAGYKHICGYLQIMVNRKQYLSHRLAWLYVYGEFSKNDIDHINCIKDENWILNLREATRSENKCNVGTQKNNTSGFKGVNFHKASNKWIARADLNGKRYNLGSFITPELANKAYQEFAKKHHGEFFHERNDVQ